MEFLMNSGLLNVVALTEEVFSASSEVFGKVAIKKVLKTSTEFEAFLSLKHENIVEAIEIIEAEEFAFVLMEFAEFGDIVKAVEYCHSIGIAHNDIKLENVLLSNGCVKLPDFGFAKSSVIVAESEEFCGTLPYAAPEVIMGMEHNTMKADMWSMGVMLYVMLFGAFPFSDSDATSMVQAQISNTLSFPENTNEMLKSSSPLCLNHLLKNVLMQAQSALP
ncbi:TSSK [Mytilus coruscus]|uniref:TSSK n=1 Tax=Mytilus coruscus TaxID=42192 RepID=A0A6J8CBQ7_MYTCO|nr:TSSK [Mytilus coruscus]